MTGEPPFFVRQNFPRSASFSVECEAPQEWVVRWQYPLPYGLWSAAALFCFIGIAFFSMAPVAVLAVTERPKPATDGRLKTSHF